VEDKEVQDADSRKIDRSYSRERVWLRHESCGEYRQAGTTIVYDLPGVG